ncbi:MAG: hypothetical protein ACJ8H8_29835 [Geminicoccaceae bacterium]
MSEGTFHPVAEILRPIIGSSVEQGRVELALPDGLTFDAWATIGEGLCRVERSIQWLIGDWWVYGERRYGERHALVKRLEAEGRDIPDFKTCMNAGVVARAFSETSRRRDVLSFTHHAEVAGLEHREQDRLLDRAEREGLTTRAIRTEVARIKNARAFGAELADFGRCRAGDLGPAADLRQAAGVVLGLPRPPPGRARRGRSLPARPRQDALSARLTARAFAPRTLAQRKRLKSL